jgi:hypothetical protein
MTFDRDTRWVGSSSLRHFPSAFCRFLFCLGIPPNLCPPRRADKNASGERLHRTLTQEGLQVRLPSTLSEVREASEGFLWHYNHERPHQGSACGNRPPQVAFASLPALPPLPQRVDPDRWLEAIHGRGFPRTVGSDGVVDVDDEHYYLQQSLAGQRVVLLVSAPARIFEVWLAGRLIKTLPLKGLVGQEMTWQQYLAFMKEQARSEERRLLDRQQRLPQRSSGT